MIPAKALAFAAIWEGGALIAATANDYSTLSVAIIGVGGALAMAFGGIYSTYRDAKHKADVADAPLAQTQLVAMTAERDSLMRQLRSSQQQVQQWERFYEALANREETTPSPSPPQTPTSTQAGSTSPQERRNVD